MNRRTRAVLAILLIAVVMGAIREFLFINLNYQIDFLGSDRPYSYAHSKFQMAVEGYGLRDLWILKWVLAALFAGIMLLLAIVLSRVLFGDHRYALTLTIGYVAIGSAALLFNSISSGNDGWYNISVKLLHALQYPIVLVFVWGASRLAAGRR